MGWSTCVTATLWVTCLGLFFEAVGFAIPFWFSLVDSTSGTDLGVFVGVWYVMACVKGESDSCKSKAIKPEFEDGGSFDDVLKIQGNSQQHLVDITVKILEYNTYWWVIQIVATVGIFLTLLATLVLICCRCAGIHSRCSFVMAAMLLFFGGLCCLGVAILTAVLMSEEFDFAAFDIDGETFPWSLLLFGLGGLLSLIASIMVMTVTAKWRRYGAYAADDKDSLDEVPMGNVNDGYGGRDPYESARKEYNNYDRTRGYGYDRERGYGSSGKYDNRGSGSGSRGQRDYIRESHSRDGYRDTREHYDYDRSYTSGRGSGGGGGGQDYMYRPYTQHRY